MKKLYTSFFLLAFLGISQLSFGQFYDGFTGTGTIGGNCADATCNENGWFTHSNTAATTIDILSGSLSYTGLQAPTGNKVYITGNTTALKRDVNAAVTGITNVAYFSALINVIDATNLSATGFDYFMHFGSTSGNSVTIFPARLGIKQGSSASNFHLGIMNTSGGTYTENTTDLTFGSTYLVVVKFDITSNTASLWINPATLGGAEPAGAITNATSATTVTAIASICIRNGYSSTNLGGTPNAEIDEIRVGTTFASVTPLSTGINEVSDINVMNVYPNPATNIITIAAKEAISNVSIYDFQGRLVQQYDFNNSTEVKLNVTELSNGIYSIVANSAKGNSFSTKLVK